MNEEKLFNQEECDLRYKMACAADADCSEDCRMKCPYCGENKES